LSCYLVQWQRRRTNDVLLPLAGSGMLDRRREKPHATHTCRNGVQSSCTGANAQPTHRTQGRRDPGQPWHAPISRQSGPHQDGEHDYAIGQRQHGVALGAVHVGQQRCDDQADGGNVEHGSKYRRCSTGPDSTAGQHSVIQATVGGHPNPGYRTHPRCRRPSDHHACWRRPEFEPRADDLMSDQSTFDRQRRGRFTPNGVGSQSTVGAPC
jgi:hypothetical protein